MLCPISQEEGVFGKDLFLVRQTRTFMPIWPKLFGRLVSLVFVSLPMFKCSSSTQAGMCEYVREGHYLCPTIFKAQVPDFLVCITLYVSS